MNYISIASNETATAAAAEIHARTAPTRSTPTNAVIENILSRSAAKYYDPTATLSDDQIRDLVRIGTSAPTSICRTGGLLPCVHRLDRSELSHRNLLNQLGSIT